MTRVPLLGLAAAALLVTTGCSGDDPSAAPTESPTVTASATPYLPVPAGVELTKPGSQLNLGEHAVVAYEPRQEQVAALDIVVDKLEKTSIDDFSAWQLSDEQKKSTPYYVRTLIENVGDTDLGGRPVPLYVVNEDNVLLESTPFASSFQPCPSTPFPEEFGPGDRTRACLVYLAPNRGDLEAVSFRPEETFNPIIWEGDVVKYEPPVTKGQTKGKDGGKQGPRKKGGTRGG
jgi:hypothetical protein